MKKGIVLFAALMGIVSLHGQYYQREYGNAGTNEELNDGTRATVGTAGQLMTGMAFTAASINLTLTRTNAAGATVGINLFNRTYQLVDANGVLMNAQSSKVLQMTTGNLVVVGNYYNTNGTTNGVFTAVFTAAGVPVTTVGWQTTPTSGTLWAESACMSTGAVSNILYVTGFSDQANSIPGNGVGPFAMAINLNTATLLWSQLYDFGYITSLSKRMARDIIVSPYTPLGMPELVVVGTNLYNSGQHDGFFFRIDANSGLPMTGAAEIYDVGTNEEIFSISVASGNNIGFVLAGQANTNTIDEDFWVMNVDPTGAVYWSNTYDYSAGGYNIGTDIMQRLNTSSQWEYYCAGTAFNSPSGTNDAVVLKLDENGNSLGEYSYNVGTGDERALEIVPVTGTASDGFCVFGNRYGATSNELLIKAYYNGVTPTACAVSSSGAAAVTTPMNNFQTGLPAFGALVPSQMTLSQLATLGNSLICNATTVVGGSNLRIITPEEGVSTQTILFPNPVSAMQPVLNINLAATQIQEVQFRVTDVLGREVSVQTFIIAEGEAVQTVQLPVGLPEGVYTLTLSGEQFNENHRFVVE